MKKIKYINCFGTSFTAGGGFEFDGYSKGRCDFLKSFYNIDNEELTQFNFSYPGQLQKISSDFKVINYAKNGYGNDRMFRLTYDLITSENFDSSEHLFLFEFGGIGRREFWYEPIGDFIVMNYWVDYDTKKLKNKVDLAHSYCYDSKEMEDFLEKDELLFLEILSKTFNFDCEIKKYDQDIYFFISYLNFKNINYFIVTSPIDKKDDRYFTFGDGLFFKKSDDFIKFTNINNLEMDIETNYLYNDKHNGYVSNKLVGQTIYNTLIDRGYLNLDKIEIDYSGLRTLKL